MMMFGALDLSSSFYIIWLNIACKHSLNSEHMQKLHIRVRFIIDVRIATGFYFYSDPSLVKD